MPSTCFTNIPLALAAADPPVDVLVDHPAGVLAVLLSVLAVIFWMSAHPKLGKIFRIIPALLFCYFVPTLLTTLGVIPNSSPLYDFVKSYVLPASLLLLILALDVPGILRLGPKAVIMLLAGTTGVVIGGPISLLICNLILPESMALPDDVWKGMAALCGSWIGGGANFVALGKIAEASDKMIAAMVIPDVFVANCWMAVLLYCSGVQHAIDRFTGANASAIRDLEQRLTDFQERVNRIPKLADFMIILAFGFGAAWLSYVATLGNWLGEHVPGLSATAWKFILITTAGVLLSFTRARNLEGAGASKIGSVMIYLLVTCIGAHADFRTIGEQPGYIIMGFIWMAFHIGALLIVGWLIRAPIFFVAVGSQANIGGAASAPVVAAAFHPSLAPVGALLAVAGYVLGTYAGLACMLLLKIVADL